MFIEENQSFKPEVWLSLQINTSSVCKIDRPETVTTFLVIKQSKMLVSFRHQLWTKVVFLNRTLFIFAFFPKKFHSSEGVNFADHLLDKGYKHRMESFFIFVVKFFVTDFFIVIKSQVKLLPPIQLYSFVSICFKDLNLSRWKFNN